MTEVDWSERTPIHTTKNVFPYSTKYYDIDGLTIHHMFRENAKRYKDRKHHGYRPYNKETKKWVCRYIFFK
jgi:hypothetical protein